MLRRRKKILGVSMMEMVVVSAVTASVLLGSLTIFISTMSDWYRGEARIDAETQSTIAVQRMSDLLRESIQVTVDADGQGISFWYPQKDVDGAYTIPATMNSTQHRLYHQQGRIWFNDGSGPIPIARNVVLTDPLDGGMTTNPIFTKGSGSIVRSIAIQVVSQTTGSDGSLRYGRAREVIYLRNVPELVN